VQHQVDIRPYAAEDEPVLFGLANLDRGADARTLEVLEREIVFVAEVAGSAAGYVALRREESRLCVEQLFVSPDHEAQGVGTRLLEHAEGFAIFEGAETLQVVVEPGNDRAASFYRGRGFVPAAGDRLELVLPRA
jgi:ribosomal protein S18 acetylase RimI-like enzyme